MEAISAEEVVSLGFEMISGDVWVISFIFKVRLNNTNMKIIMVDGRKKYGQKKNVERKELELFISSHRMFKKEMGLERVAEHIESQIKKHHAGSRGPKELQISDQGLQQLGLYLNKDNNRQIFLLMQHILNHPQGITYEVLAKRLRTDIITVSHYCCKLKKLRLIDWQHEKEGIVVYPRTRRTEQPIIYDQTLLPESTYHLPDAFLFHELTLTQNIWLNVASEDSSSRGGITNEEVKRRVMKHAENKMVRRTVESMRFLQKAAERQGKVFEFKYKFQTQALKREISKQQEENQDRKGSNQLQSEIDPLEPTILGWLQQQFPEFKGEHFLLNLINNKFKDYLSILGVKQSKRQCTPLKLNRYIKVLNYLHRDGGMRESQLRANIVKDQTPFNVGIMHKRSLLGILEGLKNLGIIAEVEGVYQPGWISSELWTKREEEGRRTVKEDQFQDPAPRKKIHTESPEGIKADKKLKKSKVNGLQKEPRQQTYHKISQHEYKCQLFTAVLKIHLQKAINRCFRKAFNRIVYVQRRKTTQKHIPQLQSLNLLEEEPELPINFNQTLQNFYGELDGIVEERGVRGEEIDVQNELVKFVRRYPSRSSSFLRIKYGKNWVSKFQQLEKQGIISTEHEGLKLLTTSPFLI